MVGTKRKRGGKKSGGRARRSRYVGVCWHKGRQKWEAQITVRGVLQYLGLFDDEDDGARAYDAAVAAQNLRYPRNFPGDTGAEQAIKQRDNRSAIPDKGKSRFVGVRWHKKGKKWEVYTTDTGKQKYIGLYDDETAAARAFDAYAFAQNLRYPLNFPGDTGAKQAVKAAEYRTNRSAIPDKGKSRFVGVSWHKQNKKWQVYTTDKGKKKFLGNYDDETAAARAFDAYVIANKINTDLNFPSAPGAAGHMTTKKGRSSRHRGVCWNKSSKKWMARIYVDGKNKSLGCFVDEDDAGRAYDAYIRKHYPDEQPKGWKRFNFPSADGEEDSADGGDDAGFARGGASSTSAAVAACAEEEEEEEEEDASSSDEEERARRRRRRRRRHRDTRTFAQIRADDEPFYACLRANFY
jgi:hypothetical protein